MKHEKPLVVQRTLAVKLKELATQFPVVTLLGPRQSGKTTLAKMVFPGFSYVTLELPKFRQLAKEDPELFFKNNPPPIIIDEVQRVPELLSHIQVIADVRQEAGQFILTGSHQPKLSEGVSQSLAGRTALLTLLPLSMEELLNAGITLDRDEAIFSGFLPRVHAQHLSPQRVYADYYRTYVERDVRQLINIGNQHAFEVFVRLLAGRVGQVVNLQSLAGDAGVSATTLSSWLSVLEASFVVFRLHCYYNNFGKRLIKAPKIYFTDVGLACSLLGIEEIKQVARDPLIGGLFENLVVIEALKARLNEGLPANLYYLRTKAGVEADLAVDRGRHLHLFEIKSGMTPDNSFARHLKQLSKHLPPAKSSTVIYAGEDWEGSQGTRFVNFTQTAHTIRSL